jgi:hypothetical protein
LPEIAFSSHARHQLALRGATEAEVVAAISEGERMEAKSGRAAYRKNFPFHSHWKGRYYETKQVMPIIVEEGDRVIVITVYAFYIGTVE